MAETIFLGWAAVMFLALTGGAIMSARSALSRPTTVGQVAGAAVFGALMGGLVVAVLTFIGFGVVSALGLVNV